MSIIDIVKYSELWKMGWHGSYSSGKFAEMACRKRIRGERAYEMPP